MKYPALLCLVLVLALSGKGTAQRFRLHRGCAYDHTFETASLVERPATEGVMRTVIEITDLMALNNDFVVKEADVITAYATKDDVGTRIIYYAKELSDAAGDVGALWALRGVIAHEIGHHVNAHNFKETNLKTLHQMELEADQFSANVLCLMGATLEQAQAGLYRYARDNAKTHPTQMDRLQAVRAQWETTKKRLRTGNTPPPPIKSGPFAFDYPTATVMGGPFQMGSLASDAREAERPARSITVQTFSMGKYEVTQAQWRAVMGDNPAHFKGCDQCPVENVSWNDVQQFIAKLNAKTGKRYRLPYEREWEYAAKQDKASPTSAWYAGQTTHPVGEKTANRWGIFDLLGNVSEWCQDEWQEDYSQMKPDGAWSVKGNASFRPLRGGAWSHSAQSLRPEHRFEMDKNQQKNFVGFRLVLDNG